MNARQLLDDFGHAIRAFLDLDEDGEVVAWERHAVFKLDSTFREVFKEMACAEKPPRCWLLMTRREAEELVHTLWWCPEQGAPQDAWPVVELSESGDASVLAGNAQDWIAAMLYTGGSCGGAAEEDLDTARDEATGAAMGLANEIREELDLDLADAEALSERYEAAQEKWSDAWMDAVEGIDT